MMMMMENEMETYNVAECYNVEESGRSFGIGRVVDVLVGE